MHATSGPISTRLVAWASAASDVHASHGPTAPLGAPIEQVVADPHRIEADLFGHLADGELFWPAHGALDLGQLDPDLQWTWHRG